jgi:sensor domain CHASE-containing protein
VFVYDQLGKMVFQTTMDQESSKTIDLSSYANANYIVKTIAKDGATSTKKVAKTN